MFFLIVRLVAMQRHVKVANLNLMFAFFVKQMHSGDAVLHSKGHFNVKL